MIIPQIDLRKQYLSIRQEIDEALLDVAAGGHYVLGPRVKELEEKAADYCGCRYGVGVASGTDALLISLIAAGIGPGDEVITSPFTFMATVDAIIRAGATPIFVDIDPLTFNIDLNLIEAAVTSKTKAVLPVHLFGQPVDMTDLMKIADRNGLNVIEDAAQAIGAKWQGKRVGSFGDAGTLSFFPTKNLGCLGDGGMIVTNDSDVAEKARALRAHGATEKYHHDILGFNSRLDEIQAAVLLVKLKYLDKWTKTRGEIAKIYDDALADSAVTIPYRAPGANHVFNQYTIRCDNRDGLAAGLREKEIATAVYYPIPLNEQKALAFLKVDSSTLREAEAAAREVLSLPIYPELSKENAEKVAEAILSFSAST